LEVSIVAGSDAAGGIIKNDEPAGSLFPVMVQSPFSTIDAAVARSVHPRADSIRQSACGARARSDSSAVRAVGRQVVDEDFQALT
jgi:hypothetical protein